MALQGLGYRVGDHRVTGFRGLGFRVGDHRVTGFRA